jgi:hypothetical protein
MGLKCYRLWAMGQLDSTCRAPPRRSGTKVVKICESKLFCNQKITSWVQGLKPGGNRRVINLRPTGAFKAMGLSWIHNLHSCPRRGARGGEHVLRLAVALQVASERRILKPVFHLIGYRLWV